MQSYGRLIAIAIVPVIIGLASCAPSSPANQAGTSARSPEASAGATENTNTAGSSPQASAKALSQQQSNRPSTAAEGQVERSASTGSSISSNAKESPLSAVDNAATNAQLQLSISEPEDEAELDGVDVRVAGKTAPGAVVSVDDSVMVADKQGAFATVVHIDESPHTLEIIASDQDGNEASATRTVFTK